MHLQPFYQSSFQRIWFWCENSISGNKYIQEVFENVYKVVMKLTIVDVDIDDFGTYKCMAKNSLGETDGSIKLYRKYFFFNFT